MIVVNVKRKERTLLQRIASLELEVRVNKEQLEKARDDIAKLSKEREAGKI